MTTDLFETNTTSYKSLKEFPDLEETIDPIRKTRIEEILIDINSASWRFQIKVICIHCLLFFAIGIHVFTFVYFFLSPVFVSSSEPSQSRKAISLNTRII